MTFTAFCQDADGTGTVWIATVEADSVDQAKTKAVAACSEDWYGEEAKNMADSIKCIGLAEGDITILMWEDIN